MPLNIKKKAYTFDDLMIIPKKSSFKTRKTIDTTGSFTKNIKLKIPIISANMDSVTEIDMAMKMSQLGAAGAIHRYMPITLNANQIWTLKKEKQIAIGSVGVIKREEMEIYSGKNLLDKEKMVKAHSQKNIMKYNKNQLCRFVTMAMSGADAIIIDIAHAHSDLIFETLAVIKCLYNSDEYLNFTGGGRPDIIIGNIATGDAVEDFMKSEYGEIISAFKTGIGPGCACTTRIVTGCGVPQLTAISDCADMADKYDVPIIADGGIRYSGDIAKAFVAGAQSVMIGGIFAGCEECPGRIMREGQGGQKKFKEYRGMASIDVQADWNDSDPSSITPEGVTTRVPYKGPVEDVLNSLVGGLKSAMSYTGSSNILEMRNAEFCEQSPAGVLEARPHGSI